MMRAFVLAIVVSGGSVALAQQSKSGLPNPDQLFQLPPSPGTNHPRFKWEIPNGAKGPFSLPHMHLLQPPSALAGDPNVDPDMIIHPQQGGFANRQPRPAQPRNLYPDLKILPTEMAQLDSGTSLWPRAREIPIPTSWPNAKMEAIPTTWDKFTMMPVRAGSDAIRSGAEK